MVRVCSANNEGTGTPVPFQFLLVDQVLGQ